jgi:hypothetical protein
VPLDAAGVGLSDVPGSACFASEVDPAAGASPSLEAVFFLGAAECRSFFAHPEPLKTIVGGANALRIVPSAPQAGQKIGPLSSKPWRMSIRWPQAVQ